MPSVWVKTDVYLKTHYFKCDLSVQHFKSSGNLKVKIRNKKEFQILTVDKAQRYFDTNFRNVGCQSSIVSLYLEVNISVESWKQSRAIGHV